MKQLGPGVYVDDRGALHVSIPEIHAHFGLPYTPDGCARSAQILADVLRALAPDAEITEED